MVTGDVGGGCHSSELPSVSTSLRWHMFAASPARLISPSLAAVVFASVSHLAHQIKGEMEKR